jgi:hypothetical protein
VKLADKLAVTIIRDLRGLNGRIGYGMPIAIELLGRKAVALPMGLAAVFLVEQL